jgi:hypothetical protein
MCGIDAAMGHADPADDAVAPLVKGVPTAPGGRIHIVGDSMAVSVERDLLGALARHAVHISLADIRNYARSASGVSHDAFENWPARARQIGITAKAGDTIVVAGLGHNDFPVPSQDSRRQERYFSRYEDILRLLKKEGVRLIVAAPVPFLEPGSHAGGHARRVYAIARWSIPKLSRKYREIAGRVGARFVDPAENPDMQARHLRSGDGLHWAGGGRTAFASILAAEIAGRSRPSDIRTLFGSLQEGLGQSGTGDLAAWGPRRDVGHVWRSAMQGGSCASLLGACAISLVCSPPISRPGNQSRSAFRLGSRSLHIWCPRPLRASRYFNRGWALAG